MNNKVLVLVDVQNDFITGSLANEEAQKVIPNIKNLIRNEWWDMIFVTKDTHSGDIPYSGTSEGRHLPIEHCVPGTYGHCIESNIARALEDCIDSGIPVVTVHKDHFGSTELADKILNYSQVLARGSNPIPEITMCGFCTDICVVSNALIMKAKLENEIYVKEDCCAGTTPENHKSAIDVMRSCQINII